LLNGQASVDAYLSALPIMLSPGFSPHDRIWALVQGDNAIAAPFGRGNVHDQPPLCHVRRSRAISGYADPSGHLLAAGGASVFRGEKFVWCVRAPAPWALPTADDRMAGTSPLLVRMATTSARSERRIFSAIG
jgi:hypothetical protein